MVPDLLELLISSAAACEMPSEARLSRKLPMPLIVGTFCWPEDGSPLEDSLRYPCAEEEVMDFVCTSLEAEHTNAVLATLVQPELVCPAPFLFCLELSQLGKTVEMHTDTDGSKAL